MEFKKLPPDELLDVKQQIIDYVDKMQYAKEILLNLDKIELGKIIVWLQERLDKMV